MAHASMGRRPATFQELRRRILPVSESTLFSHQVAAPFRCESGDRFREMQKTGDASDRLFR
jgi:hypothetical protein